MDQKRIGKFQIEIGWLLVIVSILVGSIGYYIIIDRLIIGFSGLTKPWQDVAASKALQQELIVANVVSYATLISIISIIGLVLLSVLSLLLFTNAIMFITQGTANANLSKSMAKEELSPEEAKRKFKKVLIISFVTIFLGSLLFFKPYMSSDSQIGLSLGFPYEFVIYIGGQFIYFHLYGFIINILFSILVSSAISSLYYRFILGIK